MDYPEDAEGLALYECVKAAGANIYTIKKQICAVVNVNGKDMVPAKQ
jgi:hypothetical protein